MAQAEQGIQELAACVDSLIIVPNERLKYVSDTPITLQNAFAIADDVLRQGVQSISDLILVPGMVNLDFADVTSVMKDAGYAHMGMGFATGKDKATDAADAAIWSPLLETSIEGARGVIINITGGPDLGLQEANTAAELVQRSVDPEANIIFGVVTDDNLGDEIQITVIATGFEKDENISTIGVENLVNNTWNKKINSIPSTPDNKSDNPNDLDTYLEGIFTTIVYKDIITEIT